MNQPEFILSELSPLELSLPEKRLPEKSGEPNIPGQVSFVAGSGVCTYSLRAPTTTIRLPYDEPPGSILQFDLMTGNRIANIRFDTVPVQAVIVNDRGAYVAGQYDFLTGTPGLTFTLGLRDADVGDFIVSPAGPFPYSGGVGTIVRSYKWTSVRLYKRGVIPRGTHRIAAGQLAAYTFGASKVTHVRWVIEQAVDIIVS